ncbi:MAG: DNA primase [Candidatus Shapirobacteria bacterium]
MENQVDEIKQKIDIVNVISAYLPLKKRGRHYVTNCPFHGEKTPSFLVSPELQIFKCFGCGKAGDAFTFLQEYEHISFRESLEQLAKIAGVKLQQNEDISREEAAKKILIEINSHVAKFYNYILLSHPLGQKALDYVLDRGVTRESIKLFQIGFAPTDSRLIANFLQKKGYTIRELLSTGTFGQSQYKSGGFYDRFQGRLTFALTDYRDRVLGFSGRILPFAPNQNMAKYINSPETEIYHKSQMLFGLNLAKEAIRTKSSVVIVEGEFDMISPYQIGIQNIVALKGTAFTQDQLQLLKRYTDTLILGLDSDFAGNNAAKKSIELADNLGFDIRVIDLEGKYKDPDEAVKADPDFFRSRLSKAVPIWDFIIDSSIKNFGIATSRGKSQIMAAVLPFLARISDAVTKSDYLGKLANRVGSKEEAVVAESAKYSSYSKSNITVSAPVSATPSGPPKKEKLEEILLILIISCRDPSKVAKKHAADLSLFDTPRFKTIADTLQKTKKFDPKTFRDTLPPEIRDTFQSLFIAAESQNFESGKKTREIKKTISQLNIIYLKDKLNNLSTVIANSENSDDEVDLKSIESEYNQLLAKLAAFQSQKR